LIDNTTTHPRVDANDEKKSSGMIVVIAESACAAIVFVIRTLIDRHVAGIAATDRYRSDRRCADSESRFLAMKKFSCPPASRLIVARQNRFFERIARR
jgi:hypothetical protein